MLRPALSLLSCALLSACSSQPLIDQLRWSQTRVQVKDTVQAEFTVHNMPAGSQAKVAIYQWDPVKQSRTLVHEHTVALARPNGPYAVPWRAIGNNGAKDSPLQEDRGGPTKGPVEYRFSVEANGIRAQQTSAPLWLTKTIAINAVDEDNTPLPDGTEIRLIAPDGKAHSTRTHGGKAVFKEIPVGEVRGITVVGYTHRPADDGQGEAGGAPQGAPGEPARP